MKKPLVVLDLETTGTKRSGEDWVIQFSAIKIDTEQNKIIDKINEYIRPAGNYVMHINAYLAHRIHPEFLQDKPTFADLAQRIYDFLQGCDILTYNGVAFDLPFLTVEFKRVGIDFRATDFVCYDAYKTEARRNGNKLHACFERYCGRTMEEAGLQPHDGLSDVKATYAVFRHQNEIEPVEPEEVLTDDDMFVWGEYEGEKVILINTGKYKGCPIDILKTIDRQYLIWMQSTNICENSRKIIAKALES